jgi:hypothetical protein
MRKLTLSVDEKIVARAKRYAAVHGTSVSRLVEIFLDGLSTPRVGDATLDPITRSLYGVLKGSRLSRKDYLDYLVRKYR